MASRLLPSRSGASRALSLSLLPRRAPLQAGPLGHLFAPTRLSSRGANSFLHSTLFSQFRNYSQAETERETKAEASLAQVNDLIAKGYLEKADQTLRLLERAGMYQNKASPPSHNGSHFASTAFHPPIFNVLFNITTLFDAFSTEEKPGLQVYTEIVAACSTKANIGIAWRIYDRLFNQGVRFDINFFNALIKSNIAAEEYQRALQYFNKMTKW